MCFALSEMFAKTCGQGLKVKGRNLRTDIECWDVRNIIMCLYFFENFAIWRKLCAPPEYKKIIDYCFTWITGEDHYWPLKNRNNPPCLWLTGFSGTEKTTIAHF